MKYGDTSEILTYFTMSTTDDGTFCHSPSHICNHQTTRFFFWPHYKYDGDMQKPITASRLVSEHLVGNVRLGGKRKRFFFFSRLSSWWLWSVRLNSWRLISAEPAAQRHCEDPNKGRHKNLSQYVAWRKMWQLWGTISDFGGLQLWWGLVLMVQKTSGLEMAMLRTHLQIIQQWKRHTFSL